MSITLSPLTTNQSFGVWFSRTNQILTVLSTNTVTADATLNGSVTTGNASVNGYLGAVNFSATTLRGSNGALSNTQTLSILSNVSINSTAYLGNSSANTYLGYNPSTNASYSSNGNINSYLQTIIQNANGGGNASVDLIINADSATDTSNYIDIGINSSGYSNSLFSINGPLDSYMYSANGSLAIGTASAKPLQFFANGTLANNEVMRITSGSNVGIKNTNPDATLAVTGTANVSGNVALGGTLSVTGNTSITSNVTVSGSIYVGNTVTNATLSSGLLILDGTNINSTSITSNAATAYTNAVAYVTAQSFVNTAQLSGNLANYVTITNLTSNLANYQTTAGLNANIASYLPNYSGTVNATAFTTTRSTVNTVGISVTNTSSNIFIANTSGVTVLGSLTTNTTTITGFANVANNLSVTGTISVGGDLNVTGNLVYSGVGTASIIPGTNLLYTLGNTSYRWLSLYVGSGDFTTTLTVGNNTTIGGNLVVNGTTTNVGALNTTSDVTVNGSINIGSAANTLLNSSLYSVPSQAIPNTNIQTMDYYDASTYRTAEYTIQITANTSPGITDYHTSKLLLMHDGVSAYITEYGSMYTTSTLANFQADIGVANSIPGQVRLRMTPVNTNVVVKFIRSTLVV